MDFLRLIIDECKINSWFGQYMNLYIQFLNITIRYVALRFIWSLLLFRVSHLINNWYINFSFSIYEPVHVSHDRQYREAAQTKSSDFAPFRIVW